MKKLRLFAGPNGSGKTTIFNEISAKYHCGYFVNADNIESDIRAQGNFSFAQFGLTATHDQIEQEMLDSTFFSKRSPHLIIERLSIENNTLHLSDLDALDQDLTYFAAFLADHCRNALLDQGKTFSAETVMSHPSKLDFMIEAHRKGFAVYLYFITTQDVQINIERVKDRVQAGGHNVPEELIVKRYDRSLNLLFDALKNSKKAYIIDTTEKHRRVIAELIQGEIKIIHPTVPEWFDQYVLQKLTPTDQ